MIAFWFLFAVSFVCWLLKHATLTVYYQNAPPNQAQASLSDRVALNCRSADTARSALTCLNRDGYLN